jgi:hypothetical protein
MLRKAASYPGVSRRLRETLVNKTWKVTLLTDDQKRVIDFSPVNVRVASMARDGGDSYIITPEDPIPKKIAVIPILFINDDPIFSNDYRASISLHKAVNKRISREPTEPVQMALMWGDHVYTITGATGMMYLLWAKDVVCKDVNESEVSHIKEQPLLVLTDGHWNVKAVYILQNAKGYLDSERILLPVSQIKWNIRTMSAFLPLDTKSTIKTSPLVKPLSKVAVRNILEMTENLDYREETEGDDGLDVDILGYFETSTETDVISGEILLSAVTRPAIPPKRRTAAPVVKLGTDESDDGEEALTSDDDRA